MEASRFFRNLLLFVLANLLVKPFWLLVIERGVQNAAGTASYGLYAALFSLSFYTQIILDPGLHTWNSNSLAGNPALLDKYVRAFLPLKMVLALIYMAATMLLGWILGYRGYSLYLLLLLGLVQVLISMLLYYRSNLQALHLFKTDSFFSVFDRILMILIAGFLLIMHNFSYFEMDWFVWSQIIAVGLSCAGVVIVLHLKLKEPFQWTFQPRTLQVILRRSMPFALLAVLMVLYTRTDSLMLERLLPDGDYQAGVYAAGYRLLEAANMIALLFATLLLPLFRSRIVHKQAVGDLSQPSFKLLVVFAFILAAMAWGFRAQIMSALYPRSTPVHAEVLGWLMWSFPAQTMVAVYGTLLTAKSDTRFLNRSAIAGLLANVLLNLLLIPQYGAIGAVGATLFTQTLMGLAHVLRAHGLFRLHWGMKDWLRLSIFLLLMAGSLMLRFLLPVSWVWQLLMLSCLNIIFALITGLLQLKWLREAALKR